MSQPVKLSDELILDARTTGEFVKRSIAGQVEFWARLGKGVEMLLETPQVFALCRQGASHPLSECLNSVDSAEGKQRVADFLRAQPFPHYEPHPDRHGLLIRIEANGRRTVGRFLHRQFTPVKAKARAKGR
jgi:hypothetical protein